MAPMEWIVDRRASWLVPIALLIALLTYLFTQDIVCGVTILVVFCRCALVLATPTSIMAAIGQATKHGVIIKSGEALKNMGKVDYVAFDKTGTLTHGNLTVSDILSFENSINEMDLFKLTASIESHFEHPLGKAIVSYAKSQKLEILKPEKFKMISGKGIYGEINRTNLYCGNIGYLNEKGISIKGNEEKALAKLRKQGEATILISDKNKLLGILALSDSLRSTAKEIVQELRGAVEQKLFY